MIGKRHFRLKKNGEPYYDCYCQHPELIENYEKALADNTQVWEVHHRREEFYSCAELIERGEYFGVPPEDLIFLTPSEHRKIDSHCKRVSETMRGKPTWNKGKKHSKEAKRRMSEAHKGKTHSEEWKAKMSEVRKGKHWKLVDGHRIWF